MIPDKIQFDARLNKLLLLWRKFQTSGLYRGVQIGVVVLSFDFLVYILVTNLREIDFSLRFDWGSLALGFLFTFIAFWTGTGSWLLIIRVFVPELNSMRKAIEFHLISVAIKYLPGFGLQQISKSWQLYQIGISAKRTFLLIGFEFGILVLTGLTVLAQIWSIYKWMLFGINVESSVGTVITGAFWVTCLVTPIITYWIVQSKSVETKTYRFVISIWAAEILDVLGWITLGLGFWFTLRTFSPVPFDALPYSIAVMVFSVLAGLATIFAPNGYGVRELTMSILLQPVMPLPLTVMSAFLSRVLLVVVDLFGISPLLASGLWGKNN